MYNITFDQKWKLHTIFWYKLFFRSEDRVLHNALVGVEEHPSVGARSWYIKEWSKVFGGPDWCAKALTSDSWKVAYGDISSDVSKIKWKLLFPHSMKMLFNCFFLLS